MPQNEMGIDLIDPNASTPHSVSPLKAYTQPFPTVIVQAKSYASVIPTMQMHRKDGKKLAFIHGFLETTVKADQEYLDGEIADGNPSIRVATEEEIHRANMRRDPAGTIEAQLRPKIEEELRTKLEADIRAQIAAEQGGSKIIEGTGGKDTAADKLEALKSGTGKVIMDQKASPLKGIVISANIADTAKTNK